jgi:hypothetical protein
MNSIAKIQAVLTVLLLTAILGFIALRGTYSLIPAQWEYSIVAIPDSKFDEYMAEAGNKGWELVSARRAMVAEVVPLYEVIFKRPKLAWALSKGIDRIKTEGRAK